MTVSPDAVVSAVLVTAVVGVMMMRTDTVSSMSHHDADPHDISVTAAVTESNSRMDSVDQTRSKGKARVLQRVMQRNELQRLQGDKKQKQLEKQRKVLEVRQNFCNVPFGTVDECVLHYIALHYITLHYITLHYITLHYITLHYACITSH